MWISDPETSPSTPPIPLLRAPAGRPLRVLLAGEPRRLFLHYANGRTWPCTLHRCSLCKRKLPKRLYAYYPCYTQKLERAIIELTSSAECSLLAQMSPHSTAPTGVLQASRSPAKRNSVIEVSWEPASEKHAALPAALEDCEVEAALLRLWDLPPRNGEASDNEWFATLAALIEQRTTPKRTEEKSTA